MKLHPGEPPVNWRPQEFVREPSPAGARTGATDFNTELKTGEHVARGVWTLKPNDAHTLELGSKAPSTISTSTAPSPT